RHPDRRLFSAIGFCRACADCQPGEYAGEEATKYRRYPRFTHSDTLLVRYHLWIDCADKYVDCGAVAAYMSVNHVYRPGADALPCPADVCRRNVRRSGFQVWCAGRNG